MQQIENILEMCEEKIEILALWSNEMHLEKVMGSFGGICGATDPYFGDNNCGQGWKGEELAANNHPSQHLVAKEAYGVKCNWMDLNQAQYLRQSK